MILDSNPVFAFFFLRLPRWQGIFVPFPSHISRKLTPYMQEDELVIKYVEQYGTKQWARIAQVLEHQPCTPRAVVSVMECFGRWSFPLICLPQYMHGHLACHL
jgi:hypothetical protein